MDNLKVFKNEEFGLVRTMTINNEPYFVGKDVATILGYKDTSDAIKRHVDDEDKLTRCFTDSGQRREMYIINESGMYSLVLSSKLPTAKKFKRWVTSEVLPSIRKNGGYIAGQEEMSDEELLAKALVVAQNKIAEKNIQIKELESTNEKMLPKAIFADAVATSKSSILIGDLAKLISQNIDKKIGQNRLFHWLRENGYLIKSGASRNMPTQRYLEMGLFQVKESNVQNPDGSVRITKTTKVTGKGQIYFINKFLNKEGVIK